jgi:hypothetical protein
VPDPATLSRFSDLFLYRYHSKLASLQTSSHQNSSSVRLHSHRRLPNILLMQKDLSHASHKCFISNMDDIVSALRKEYPLLNVNVISWSGKTVMEQIAIMQDTDITISIPGTDLLNVLFMPLGVKL